MLNKFAADFTFLELSLYDHAVKDGDSFVNNPCTWKPDADVAASDGFSYDPTPYCRANQSVFITASTFHIPGPKPEYLYAAAFKAIYGQISNTEAQKSSKVNPLNSIRMGDPA